MRILGAAATFLVVTLLAVVSWTCKDDITDGSIDDIVFPDSGVSYGRHVQPVFDRTCAFSGCHGADTFEEFGFSLDSYLNATNRTDIIIPRDTVNSKLVWRIEGLFGFPRMPLDRPPLNTNQTRGLKRWILEGAKDN